MKKCIPYYDNYIFWLSEHTNNYSLTSDYDFKSNLAIHKFLFDKCTACLRNRNFIEL